MTITPLIHSSSTNSIDTDCSFCRLPKAKSVCGICQASLCNKCREILSEKDFSLLPDRSAELSHAFYCPTCFDTKVAEAKTEYLETFERAKNVGYWPRTYQGHVPVLEKSMEIVSVENCKDEKDVLMKLGFLAARKGFNGLVQGTTTRKKVRNFGYQKMVWSGQATPARIDEEKLNRNEFREAHWRVLAHR